jgi:hypothetical protein
MQHNCQKCGADLEVVGVLAVIQETAIFMGNFGETGLQRIASEGERRVVGATCRGCGAAQAGEFAEALQAA